MTGSGYTHQSVGVRLQSLSFGSQALVLGSILERRGQRAFRPAQIADFFDEFGLPGPQKIGNVLAALKTSGLMRPAKERGLWLITPLGREQALELLSADDLASLLLEITISGGATLGKTEHALVPPNLAPPAIIEPLSSFLSQNSFEANVLAMTRFPVEDESGSDPLSLVIPSARSACADSGLQLNMASDRMIVDDIWGNVAAHMWACKYGVAFFEDRQRRGINYNLSIEVGSMLMTGRRCLLLKDVSVETLPTDLVGMIYTAVDFDDASSVAAAIQEWASESLHVG